MPNGCCHVVAAGPCERLELHMGPRDYLIAADGGFNHCVNAGFTPDFFIGDFDSLAVEELEGAACDHAVLPCAKDDTDTMAALKAGLERGYTKFAVHAALGGDVGHELANIQALFYLRSHGADGVLYGNGQAVYAILPEDGLRDLPTARGMRVSVFAYSGPAGCVVERGLRWELEDGALEPDFPLGVSNSALGDCIQIGVRKGALVVVVG